MGCLLTRSSRRHRVTASSTPSSTPSELHQELILERCNPGSCMMHLSVIRHGWNSSPFARPLRSPKRNCGVSLPITPENHMNAEWFPGLTVFGNLSTPLPSSNSWLNATLLGSRSWNRGQAANAAQSHTPSSHTTTTAKLTTGASAGPQETTSGVASRFLAIPQAPLTSRCVIQAPRARRVAITQLSSVSGKIGALIADGMVIYSKG